MLLFSVAGYVGLLQTPNVQIRRIYMTLLWKLLAKCHNWNKMDEVIPGSVFAVWAAKVAD